MDQEAFISKSFPIPFGRYHLLYPLAKGGMGDLYVASTGQDELGRLCVLKMLLPHLSEQEYKVRFHDEMKVMIRLSQSRFCI